MLKPCGHWPPSAWTGHFTFIGFISTSSHIYSFTTVTYSLLHVVYNKLYAPHWLFLLGVGGDCTLAVLSFIISDFLQII